MEEVGTQYTKVAEATGNIYIVFKNMVREP